MLEVIGWLIWCVVAYLAGSFIYGCRTYAKHNATFHWATGIQTFFFTLIAILFLIFDWNKLHILWILPIAYYGAQFLVHAGIPIVRPLVLFFTNVFLQIILVGTKKSNLPK